MAVAWAHQRATCQRQDGQFPGRRPTPRGRRRYLRPYAYTRPLGSLGRRLAFAPGPNGTPDPGAPSAGAGLPCVNTRAPRSGSRPLPMPIGAIAMPPAALLGLWPWPRPVCHSAAHQHALVYSDADHDLHSPLHPVRVYTATAHMTPSHAHHVYMCAQVRSDQYA